MNGQRSRISRALTRATKAVVTIGSEPTDIEAPRKAGGTLV